MIAIKIGEVSTPKTANNIPSNPAIYSLFMTAKTPKMKAIGLSINDNRKTPIKPKIILILP